MVRDDASTPAPPPAFSAPLSVARITTAAIELLEELGPSALSMRRLGKSLGVEAMSLYHHVPSRDALLSAVAAHLLAPLADLPLGDTWQDACLALARCIRRIAVEHPASFRLTGLQPLDSASSLRGVERFLAALVDRGIEPAAALTSYRAVASFARGYALAEVAGSPVDASDPAGRRHLSELDPAAFPLLAGATDQLATVTPNGAFEDGLAALVAGLAGPAGPR